MTQFNVWYILIAFMIILALQDLWVQPQQTETIS